MSFSLFKPGVWSIKKWEDQACQEGGVGGKLPWTLRRLGAPPSPRNIKYTRMHHFEKKNFKSFLPRGAPQKCLGQPCENVSLGPTVALDGPGGDT